MIPPAPADFWKQVIDRFAELIWERERKTGGALETVARKQGPTMAELREGAPGTMPPPAPTEAAE